MVDLHCHILPKIDDGSRSMAESVAMARLARASGVDRIAATPHFPGRAESVELLPKILNRVTRLRSELEREGIDLMILPGAEILCLPETAELAKKGMLPTIGDSRYLLTEFYFDTPAQTLDAMLRALAQREYIPVIAHPERYGAVQRRPELARRWFEQGYVIQVNKGSVLGAFGPEPERCAGQLLRQGTVHVIASDAHRADARTTDMGPVRAWAEENLGREYADVLLRRNPGRIIAGKSVVPV